MPAPNGNVRRGPAPVQKHVLAVNDPLRPPPAPGKVAPAKPQACPNCPPGPQGPRGANGLNVECPCCLPECPNYLWKYTSLLGISRLAPNDNVWDAIDGQGNPEDNPNCLVANADAACDLYNTKVCPHMPEPFMSRVVNDKTPNRRVWVMGVVCCEGEPSGSSEETSYEETSSEQEISSEESSEKTSSGTGPGPYPPPSASSEETPSEGSGTGQNARYIPCTSSYEESSAPVCWQLTLCEGPGSNLVSNDLRTEYENTKVIEYDGFCYNIFGEYQFGCEGAIFMESFTVHADCPACLGGSSAQEVSSAEEGPVVGACEYAGCAGCTTTTTPIAPDYQAIYDFAVANCGTTCPGDGCGEWCGTFIMNDLGGGFWSYTCCCQEAISSAQEPGPGELSSAQEPSPGELSSAQEVSSAVPEAVSSAIPVEVSSAQENSSEVPYEQATVLYAVDYYNLYTINPATGAKTFLTSLNDQGFNPRSMVYDWRTDTIYVKSATDQVIGTVDPITGVYAYHGVSDVWTGYGGWDMNPDRTKLYVSDWENLYEWNAPTSSLTFKLLLQGVYGNAPASAIASIPGGQSYLFRKENVYPIDLDTQVVGTGVPITGLPTEGGGKSFRDVVYFQGTFYAIAITTSYYGLFGTIDPTTGVFTAITSDVNEQWMALAAAPPPTIPSSSEVSTPSADVIEISSAVEEISSAQEVSSAEGSSWICDQPYYYECGYLSDPFDNLGVNGTRWKKVTLEPEACIHVESGKASFSTEYRRATLNSADSVGTITELADKPFVMEIEYANLVAADATDWTMELYYLVPSFENHTLARAYVGGQQAWKVENSVGGTEASGADPSTSGKLRIERVFNDPNWDLNYYVNDVLKHTTAGVSGDALDAIVIGLNGQINNGASVDILNFSITSEGNEIWIPGCEPSSTAPEEISSTPEEVSSAVPEAVSSAQEEVSSTAPEVSSAQEAISSAAPEEASSAAAAGPPLSITVSGATSPSSLNGVYTRPSTAQAYFTKGGDSVTWRGVAPPFDNKWQIGSFPYFESSATTPDADNPVKTGYTGFGGATGTPTISY